MDNIRVRDDDIDLLSDAMDWVLEEFDMIPFLVIEEALDDSSFALPLLEKVRKH